MRPSAGRGILAAAPTGAVMLPPPNRLPTAPCRAFTLTELVVALALLATLAGLALGAGRRALESTRVSRARAELAVLAAALEVRDLRRGGAWTDPDPAALLRELARPATPARGGGPARPLLDAARFRVIDLATGESGDVGSAARPALADPWDRPYLYRPPTGSGRRGCVFSAGPDGDPATESDNVLPD